MKQQKIMNATKVTKKNETKSCGLLIRKASVLFLVSVEQAHLALGSEF